MADIYTEQELIDCRADLLLARDVNDRLEEALKRYAGLEALVELQYRAIMAIDDRSVHDAKMYRLAAEAHALYPEVVQEYRRR